MGINGTVLVAADDQEPVDQAVNYSVKDYLTFIVPSLLGVLFFLLPVEYDGKWTIPMGVLSSGLETELASIMPIVVLTIVIVSLVLTLAVMTWVKVSKPEVLNFPLNQFDIPMAWVIIRGLGAMVAVCVFFELGPEWIWGSKTGHVVFYDLAIPIVTIFIFAAFLLPLLTDYGLMEFVGALLRSAFQTVFGLPGRSCVDAMASWMAASSVGVLITSQQYEKGFYTGREAAVISTNFSVVSLPFCLIVAQFVGLDHMFITFYLTVSFAGVVAAIITPRLPPLSRIPDNYAPIGKQIDETDKTQVSVFKSGLNTALAKAKKAPGFKGLFVSAIENISDIWFGLMPPLMFIATLGLVLTEYTPIVHWLSMPFVPVLELLQLPEAAKAAPAMVVGFAEMFLPAVVASGIESELTRFVIISVSIAQLIYMSEMGVLILKTNIPLNLWQLMAIFLVRTAIILPIIAGIAHFIVF